MIEALRGLGYSTATAIADIIDNSIAAGANEVDIQFHWRGDESAILILDNGIGMDDAMLDRAMRLGDRDPLEEREISDLGRFGLGLKTASFSQARRLTVASKFQGGAIEALRWDLDYLRQDSSGDWTLLEGAEVGSESYISLLRDRQQGTIVLWENMDRVTPTGATDQDFLDLIDTVERHLSVVFHRFIEERRLEIRINDGKIAAWDPFLESRPDTWRSGLDRIWINGHQICVEGFVLPHKDRLPPKVYDDAAGPDGWTAQQGFYVYRNKRLLVGGHWLGLGRGRSWTKEEPFRLARIKLDIPNSADDDWKIDIRKSKARPPLEARARLSLFAEDVRERARKVFAFRGHYDRPSRTTAPVTAWRADHSANGVRYRVDRTHPVVAAVLENSALAQNDIIAMLRVVEETVPVQQIWLDTAEAKETPKTRFDGVPPDEIRSVLQTVFNNLVHRKGFTEEQARRQLSATDPFDSWPDLIELMTANPEENSR
tara:strand:+ start:26293 stop:27753 length:1461 start_codon:yes stop_codon:yes gene_type:complete